MQEIVAEGELSQFAKQYCGDRNGLDLLLFLGRHPHAWFSQLTIIQSLGAPKADIVEAIQHLTDKGLVVTQTSESGLRLYSLAQDSPSHDMVLEMAADYWQYRLVAGLASKGISLRT